MCPNNCCSDLLKFNLSSLNPANSARFNKDETHILTASHDNTARIWAQYTEWTIDQLLLYKLLFTWILVEKPNKKIDSVPNFITQAIGYSGCNKNELTTTWNTFPPAVQKHIWSTVNYIIQKYGK